MLDVNANPLSSSRGRLPRRALSLMPSGLTLAAAFCGFTALRLSGDHHFGLAMAAIAAAALFDIADGLAARRLNAASDFGAELDSLADFLNFGIAPAILLYQRDLHRLGWPGWIAAAIYAAAAMVRLARFNVELKKGTIRGSARIFSGLPSTAAALAAVVAALASSFAGPTFADVLAAVLFILAALMISPIPVPSLEALLNRSWPRGENRR